MKTSLILLLAFLLVSCRSHGQAQIPVDDRQLLEKAVKEQVEKFGDGKIIVFTMRGVDDRTIQPSDGLISLAIQCHARVVDASAVRFPESLEKVSPRRFRGIELLTDGSRVDEFYASVKSLSPDVYSISSGFHSGPLSGGGCTYRAVARNGTLVEWVQDGSFVE